MGSVYVLAFFAFIALALEGSGLAGLRDKVATDFLPTYAAELALWPAVQAVNFSRVPVRLGRARAYGLPLKHTHTPHTLIRVSAAPTYARAHP